MARATAFLGDARGRLLPASIPFRFFGAAAGFHLLAWISLLVGGAQLPGYAGGLGLPLAALHLLTLGVLVMTAIGASLQLLPVATRQPLGPTRLLAALWWCYAPGVAALATAMAWGETGLLAAAACWLALALAGYALLLGRNLARARGMPVVVVHGWAALLCLWLLLASGLSLASAFYGHGTIHHGAIRALHVALAAYGFMGLLVLGFSYILVPMFALAETPAERASLLSAALVILGLALAALSALGLLPAWAATVAIVCGLAGLGLHVRLMLRALRSGMRRELGRPFVLVRLGWALLACSLLAALALEMGLGAGRLRTLFVVLLMSGLLSFLLGVLSRIVPFLASMHAPQGKRGPPLPSALSSEPALAMHLRCHLGALALLLAAVLADSPWLARTAGVVGTAGALAFGWFFVHAWRRMQAKPVVAGPAAQPHPD